MTHPRLGILNLMGDAYSLIATQDEAALASFFLSSAVGTSTPPPCDVLLLYCDFSEDGRIVGASSGLREIIRDSNAHIVIVASANPAQRYAAATRPAGYGEANLVFTIDRRGPSFALFYRRLFELMSTGVSMPVAWVKLAPQAPGAAHEDAPDSIFAIEVGQIDFGPEV
ncbi:MAG: hypothetical protein U0Q16_26705 [Bryobacteraceae bacterium]